MRLRVAKIGEHAVAHILSDKPVGRVDYLGDSTVICRYDFAQVLWIELRGERCGADQVAEQHGQLPPRDVGIDTFSAFCLYFDALIAQSGNRSEQFAAMPN